MDIEILKELKQQIKGVHDGINGDDFNLLYDLLPLIDEAIARQSVTSEEVQHEIDRLSNVLEQTKEAAKELKEQKYAVNMLPVYDQIKSLELQITALQAYRPWIPVSERLPGKRVDVLTYRENGYCKVLRFETDGKWYDSYNEWENNVTHWKPLPEIPKGE